MTIILSVMALTALAGWLLWERARPAFSWPGTRTRIIRNVLLGAAGFGTTFLVVTPVSIAAAELGPAWREGWGFWSRLGTDLLLLEFFIYWWHRANHEIPLLWRFHRVHHYDEFLDVTSSLRFHPGELLLSAVVRGSFIFALDISVPAILLFDAMVVIAAGFHHSNVDLPEWADRRFRLLIVTPLHHRIHHIPEQKYTDSNYGTLTTLFDRLFGSYRNPRIDGRYGVEGARDESFPELMLDPFR